MYGMVLHIVCIQYVASHCMYGIVLHIVCTVSCFTLYVRNTMRVAHAWELRITLYSSGFPMQGRVTPLHVATALKKDDVVRVLLAHNVNIQAATVGHQHSRDCHLHIMSTIYSVCLLMSATSLVSIKANL
jgi:hypothetical protein